jgi:Leucine-rich repeat (LRR) protein
VLLLLDLSSNPLLSGTVPVQMCGQQLLSSLSFRGDAGLYCYHDCLSTVASLDAGAVPRCPTSQDVAICSFVAATNIYSLTNPFLSEWLCSSVGSTVTDPCLSGAEWTGILCDNGTIVDIALSFMGVTGTLPSALAELNMLTRLDLTGNLLSSTIPATFGSLSSLVALKFEHNKLSGSIPSAVFNSPSLKDLFVSDNEITGRIPTDLGPSLTSLVLGLNKLSGGVPSEIGLLPLSVLGLNGNSLSGE